ncbi:aminoglycoside phosphotransferase family protein [Isoptericola sp. b408]|uniref:aminoglycoside phosphotransferase family protein n=1 Tax=Isoptericola sp. b408 TaxID=3064653 RepID=UPI002713FFA5|nr:aminoglycoside phosphotransferase family protein [Isoptericola sp. b408]MDO8151286.1 aminoglycoside phosphotransferase family protein [Isoptericola sp. b408]
MAAAEIEIDVDLVRALLEAQHPDLADGPLRVAAEGWDNVMVRLGDDLAVRLPRREPAAPLVVHEQESLPWLAARLPVPVPAPVRVGVPSTDPAYPWHWSVVPWFAGHRAADVPRPRRQRLAAPLAAFLDALHAPALDAPVNPVRGVPLTTRDEAVRRRLADPRVGSAARLAAVWEDALAAPLHDGPAVWVHGDPHPGNVVVGDDDGLAAVVDFGDVTSGDPATDLATAWLTFDDAGRAEFRRALAHRYPADDPVWVRARGWAVAMASAMVVDSSAEHAWLPPLGVESLDQVLADASAEDAASRH